MVFVHRSEELVALEEGLDVGAVSGGERHRQSVQRVELVPNRLMEEREYQNWRFRQRPAEAAAAIGGGIHLAHRIRHHRHSAAAVHVLQSRQRRRHPLLIFSPPSVNFLAAQFSGKVLSP